QLPRGPDALRRRERFRLRPRRVALFDRGHDRTQTAGDGVALIFGKTSGLGLVVERISEWNPVVSVVDIQCGLGRTQKEVTSRPQHLTQFLEDGFARFSREVDEHVTQEHDVEASHCWPRTGEVHKLEGDHLAYSGI